jgi:hypothetical protein
MNKLLRYALTCIGVLCFIELQIITFNSVNNSIKPNNNLQPPMEMNSTNRNKDNRENGMSAPGTDKIEDNKTNTSETSA